MKWYLFLFLFLGCQSPEGPVYEQLSDSTYVNLIIDMSIADVAVNREANVNLDSLRHALMEMMQSNYHLDSLQISQAIDYLSEDLPRMKRIYERVSEQLNLRIDSLSMRK